jgi:glycosyltransferase involved in cell wall biosynthesis
MKIALVMAGNEEGGLEKHVVELANALARRGHAVSLVAHEKYSGRLDSSVTFHAVDLARSRRSPLALFQLWKALKQSGAELVHAHGAKAASMVGFVLPWLAVRSVASIHSLKKRHHMFGRFDAVIAVSRYVADGLAVKALHLIHNGLDLPAMADGDGGSRLRRMYAPDGRPLVLAVGRLVPVKGFEELIEHFPVESGRLIVAGDGAGHGGLEARIAARRAEADIRLLGQRDDIPALLSAVDLLVISSRQEGGPYVLAEALQAGVPVVSTAVGMVPDVLPEEWTCPPNAPEVLCDLIQRALANPEGIRRSQAGAMDYARNVLSLSGMTDRVEMVYHEVLS